MELTRYRQIALYVLIFGVHHFDSDELVGRGPLALLTSCRDARGAGARCRGGGAGAGGCRQRHEGRRADGVDAGGTRIEVCLSCTHNRVNIVLREHATAMG